MRGSIVVAALCVGAAAAVSAQGAQQLRLFLSLADARGNAPASLSADDIQITEGVDAKYVLNVVGIERIEWPVKVQILIDNGLGMDVEGLNHIRSGLRGLLSNLPDGIEVAIYTTAPQPRPFVRATTDRQTLLKSVDRLVRETGVGRLLDGLKEAAQRVERDTVDHFPVIISVTTTAADSRINPGDVEQLMRRLKQRAIVVHSVMLQPTGLSGNVAQQSQLGLAIRERTGGRFESLAVPTRLATLLPEIGAQVAASHRRQSAQFRVTVERPIGRSGPAGPITASIRQGLTGALTFDGVIP